MSVLRTARRRALGVAVAAALVGALALPGLVGAQTTLSGSLSLSTNTTGASGVQDTLIAQQTSGTPVSISGGSVVVTLPSNQSLPSGWSVSDVTTENIPSPGTITQSGNTLTIPFTGTLSTGTQITVIVTDVTNSGTAGSASATVDEDSSSGTVEATGSFGDTLANTTVQATVTVAEALAISPVAPASVAFAVDPATVTQASAAVGGVAVLSNAASTAVTVTATTPTDSATSATLPWSTSTPGLSFTPDINGTAGTAAALGSTPVTLDSLSGPTGNTAVNVTGTVNASVNWTQPAGVYTTTITYAVSPTY
jgi:hypothetical protein